ncbi:hypothetical protein QJQ45_016859 [Haematococcus lacustris]|nr:hypothetical protein QJQ45_016859 [Haematococcus lacustris]
MIIAVLLAGCAFILSWASWILQRSKDFRNSAQCATLTAEIAELRREAVRLNTPATFSKSAKAQREAARKEKELALLNQPSSPNWQHTAGRCIRVLQVVLPVAAGVWCWGQPVAQVLPSAAWPVGGLLSKPHGAAWSATGLVAAWPWFMLCSRACTALAKASLPASR